LTGQTLLAAMEDAFAEARWTLVGTAKRFTPCLVPRRSSRS